MNLKMKSLTAPALSSAVIGLLIASLSQGTQAADLGTIAKAGDRETPQTSLNTSNSVKTQRVFDGFEIEIEAPSNVDPSVLLRDVPAITTAAATGDSPKASTEESFKKVADAIDKVRSTQFRNVPLSLTITRTGASVKPQSTYQYVDLYRVFYRWNYTVGYGGTYYAYNYYVNTVSCFARNQYGTWRPAYQSNGSWYYPSYIYGGGVGAMTASGYDNYKGCYWQGLSSSNKGDFVIYMYN